MEMILTLKDVLHTEPIYCSSPRLVTEAFGNADVIIGPGLTNSEQIDDPGEGSSNKSASKSKKTHDYRKHCIDDSNADEDKQDRRKRLKRISDKKYQDTHKEEIKERNKIFYNTHKEQKKEQNNMYYETHKEEILKKQKIYYNTHKEQYKKQHNMYYETHKEEIKEINKKYRDTHKEEIKERDKKKYAHRKEVVEIAKLLLNMNSPTITSPIPKNAPKPIIVIDSEGNPEEFSSMLETSKQLNINRKLLSKRIKDGKL